MPILFFSIRFRSPGNTLAFTYEPAGLLFAEIIPDITTDSPQIISTLRNPCKSP